MHKKRTDTPCQKRISVCYAISGEKKIKCKFACGFFFKLYVGTIQCSLKYLDCSTKFAVTLLVLDIALYKSGQMRLQANFSRIHNLSHSPVSVLRTSLALMFIYCRYRFLTNTV